MEPLKSQHRETPSVGGNYAKGTTGEWEDEANIVIIPSDSGYIKSELKKLPE
jgi:hypothetical protein